ncbi:MAG: S-methyl-5'-thioadenosine phosphorylase [Elusimicrobia bacterium]|nr:S-methyl-5'-thioadenosine phosphorylase [Elusimicrobiota bacterium]
MAGKKLAEIGIIGGSGLYEIKELSNKREIKIKTPFGAPSDAIILGSIAGIKCAFLPRHGRKHAILPTEIPQKANLWALKSIGVKTIISVSAVGSLKQSLPPAHFVFPNQFVDETRLRDSTFFGNGIVGHVPMAEPFCEEISKLMYKESKKMKIKSHLGGTYVCMEGPSFSTKAESFYHRKMGYSIIGMTMATEAKLAREAGFCYAPVSLVTDYDCWKEDDTVDQEKVTRTLKLNIENIKKLLVRALPQIGKMKRRENCCNFTKGSVLTARKDIPAKLYNKLKLIIE